MPLARVRSRPFPRLPKEQRSSTVSPPRAKAMVPNLWIRCTCSLSLVSTLVLQGQRGTGLIRSYTIADVHERDDVRHSALNGRNESEFQKGNAKT